MALTAPEHPGLTQRSGAAAVIAYLERTTPEVALAYLEHRTEDPAPRRRPGPQVAQCPSWCGHLQAQEGFPFPLTFDGEHQSCEYRQFLELHQDAPAQLRETAAARQVQKVRERRHAQRAQPRRNTPEENQRQAALF